VDVTYREFPERHEIGPTELRELVAWWLSPPTSEGPTFAGITGTQGPTR